VVEGRDLKIVKKGLMIQKVPIKLKKFSLRIKKFALSTCKSRLSSKCALLIKKERLGKIDDLGFLFKKFNVKNEEIGKMWEVFDKACNKGYCNERLAGYFCKSLRNYRINNYKKRVREVTNPLKIELLPDQTIDLERCIYIQDRINAFKFWYPEYALLLDMFLGGKEINRISVWNMVEKFEELMV